LVLDWKACHGRLPDCLDDFPYLYHHDRVESNHGKHYLAHQTFPTWLEDEK
jgi:hypothetical protein